jgi:Methyltransferase domain
MSLLEVPGARLCYETRGSGPLMLMVPGASGEAGIFKKVTEPLAAYHTVVTYDRRGLSRSQLEGPQDYDRRLATDVDYGGVVMGRPRKLMILLGAAATAVAAVRHGRGAARGRQVPGGILIGDAAVYDTLSRLMLGSFVAGIAADVAAAAPARARVPEGGCGPGHLSIRLARQHGLEVTCLDLDPAMITRARANADGVGDDAGAVRRLWSVTWPRWRSPTPRSTWWSARCRYTTGPTRPPGWARSAACCAQGAGRWSGTCGPACGHIRSGHATRTCSTRSSTPMAPRFGWWTRRHGAGPGGSPSSSESS